MNDFPDGTPCIGLDWFILDLLGSMLIFIFIEKLFPLRKDQPLFRLFGWAVHGGVQDWVRGLNFWVALFLIILVADLVQYATHRAWPARYGVLGDYVPEGLWRQLEFPFGWRKPERDFTREG